MVAAGQLSTSAFATHHFNLADIEQAYTTFADAATSHALKVVLTK